MSRKNVLTPYLFLTPALLVISIFTLYPIISVVYYSFTDYNILQPPLWVGIDNFSTLFGDRIFRIDLRNTLFMVVIGLPVNERHAQEPLARV